MKFDFTERIKSGVDQAMKECELTIGMTLKEAVERQMPQKLIEEKHTEPFCITYYRCPRCKENRIAEINGKQGSGKVTKYCGNCGQALDWEDVEIIELIKERW